MSIAGERPGQRSFGSELHEAMQQCVVQHRMVERVLADQRRRQMARSMMPSEASPPCIGEASPIPTSRRRNGF